MSYTAEFNRVVTEERNPNTMDLDVLNTLELVKKIQHEDLNIASVVERAIPEIAKAVDIIHNRITTGGRLLYFGAGTSGRLGVLDATECPPTFGVDPYLVQAFIAGGKEAMFQAFEGAEDSKAAGVADVALAKVTPADVVVGITASGRTPYVLGVAEKAKELGATVIVVVNNNKTDLDHLADVVIAAVVGPEALSGSTRMKAGTAQKMVLNLLSTCTMVRLGKVYENLMVDLKPTNEKLRERAVSIISTISGVPRHVAEGALVASHDSAKAAIVMVKRKIGRAAAETLLAKCGGSLRKSLEASL
ncbi:MAG: N-acetylmuramic acid 6-phosphate etherase [Candidatus Melainabacteria bacterium]|nr:N-acetylmuramic acid 6-phosphate etherase [Candidatus Melainabacteria bacterium]